MKISLENICQNSRAIAAKAAKYIKEQRGSVSVEMIEEKSLNSFVSFVDREAEKMLVDELGKIIPGSTFITEEDTVINRESEYTWVVDPLDGTTNYLQGIPHCCVSIGLQVEGEYVIGIIRNIDNEEEWYGWKGGGCYLDGELCRVSDASDLAESIVGTGFPYHSDKYTEQYVEVLKQFINRGQGVRRFGSAALDLAYVACGRLDAYYEYKLNAWDIAAGSLLVMEAGGRIGSFCGDDSWKTGNQIIAATPAVFEEVREILGTLSL